MVAKYLTDLFWSDVICKIDEEAFHHLLQHFFKDVKQGSPSPAIL